MYCAVTTYLPALVWICCFYVLGREGEGQRTEQQKNLWFQKKKEKEKDLINTVKHVTYVTVYCNSLLEIIKI